VREQKENKQKEEERRIIETKKNQGAIDYGKP